MGKIGPKLPLIQCLSAEVVGMRPLPPRRRLSTRQLPHMVFALSFSTIAEDGAAR